MYSTVFVGRLRKEIWDLYENDLKNVELLTIRYV